MENSNRFSGFNSKLGKAIELCEYLDEKREKVIALTRKLNRISGRGIAQLVKGEKNEESLQESSTIMGKIFQEMRTLAPYTSWNICSQGAEEYVEFQLLHALTAEEPLLSYEELNVPASIWLLGLGDVIGELRRIILNLLLDKKDEEAKYLLGMMELIYEKLVGLDFHKTIVGSLRKKIDTARVLLERTLSDMLNASLK